MAVTSQVKSTPQDVPSYVRTPAARYLASLAVDRRLYREDIAGGIAHVEMLGKAGLLTEGEVGALVRALRQVRREMSRPDFPWREDLEDVHTNVEARLTEILGPLGAKLHTARSRNDQVALDERLWLRTAIHEVSTAVLGLQETLVARAEEHAAAPMPGYTHLQRAQAVTLGHHLLAHFWRLSRDAERLADAFHRANLSPLGAGALAGSTLPIDPASVSQRLGFAGEFENSLDAVSDRDFLAEYLFALALLAVHLSALGEELVLWSSSEFGFVRPAAALGSGSSLMPQKRNPDVAELARAKAATGLGDLVALLATLKALPLSYHRDLQEDKAAVFRATDAVLDTLEHLGNALAAVEFDTERMAAAAADPRLLVTDLAEHLVAQGVPFREAHELLATHVAAGGALTPEALRALHPKFADASALLDPRQALARRNSPGGPGPAAVRVQIEQAHEALGRERHVLSKIHDIVQVVDQILTEEPK